MKNPPISLGGSLALAFIILSLQACVHPPVVPPMDNDPDPVPVDSTQIEVEVCDPDTVYFAQQIQPILNSNCALSGCHNEQSAQDDIVLTSYGNLISSDVIDAGDPSDSDLYEVITENDPDKIMPPPPNAALTTEQIETIRTWIRQGAQNLSCEEAVCDTSDVTYAGYIRPFLDLHCTGCHTGTNAGGGVFLSGFSTVQEVALNGRLLGSIQHDEGFVQMPQGEDKLESCDITKIRLWIEEGAPNN